MSDQAEQPLPFAPAIPLRRWRVTMADKTARTIEAPAFRVEGGALVFALRAGNAAAYASGTWATVEAEQ